MALFLVPAPGHLLGFTQVHHGSLRARLEYTQLTQSGISRVGEAGSASLRPHKAMRGQWLCLTHCCPGWGSPRALPTGPPFWLPPAPSFPISAFPLF